MSCSHGIATDYFRLSVNPDVKYKATTCSSLVQPCLFPKEDYMGYYAAGSSGDFYLTVTGSSPYAIA